MQQTHPTSDSSLLHRTLTLPNDIEAIPQLNGFIDGIAEEAGLDMSLTMSLNLALEEAVVNVMNYAYPPGERGEVNLDVTADGEKLVFVLTDSGKAFDPTRSHTPDTTLPAEERPIGGLGIHLVRQIMDDISYERAHGMNVLTLSKKIS